jgi:hypothetical protein
MIYVGDGLKVQVGMTYQKDCSLCMRQQLILPKICVVMSI